MSEKIPVYVNMRKLRELVSMSRDTIHRRMKDAGFPKPKRGGRWKWKEVEAWMDGGGEPTIPSEGHEDQTREIKDASAAYFATHH